MSTPAVASTGMATITTTNSNASRATKAVWAGRVISAIPALMVLTSGINLMLQVPMVTEGMARTGYPVSTAPTIGVLAFVSALLYIIPRTAVLGAILLTGYLGGAVATHLRIGDPSFPPAIFGVLAWLGLYLRDARLRALLPLRAR